MSDYRPEVGHRVRLVLDGALVTQVEGEHLRVSHGDAQLPAASYFWLRGRGVSVERLPDPEPEWQPGDVVLGASGATYLVAEDDSTGRSTGRRFLSQYGGWSRHAPSNARLLVRDGKPVTP